MNEQEKQQYHEEYKKEKEKGVFFFPDIIFKDAVIALIIFLVLVGLAFFIGAPLEERARIVTAIGEQADLAGVVTRFAELLEAVKTLGRGDELLRRHFAGQAAEDPGQPGLFHVPQRRDD